MKENIVKSYNIEGYSIILENKYNQLFLLCQEKQQVVIYELIDLTQLKRLNMADGWLYHDLPAQNICPYKSSLHFVDEKNDRIIVIIYPTAPYAIEGYPAFSIVGFDYAGKQLFTILVDKEIEPVAVRSFSNGDLLLMGRYNQWIGQKPKDNFSCIMRVDSQGNCKWNRIKKCARKKIINNYGSDQYTWIYTEFGDWKNVYVTEDDRIFLEVGLGMGKKKYAQIKENGKFQRIPPMLERTCLLSSAEIYLDADKIQIIDYLKESLCLKYNFDYQCNFIKKDTISIDSNLNVVSYNREGVVISTRDWSKVEYRKFDGTIFELKLANEDVRDNITDLECYDNGEDCLFFLALNSGGHELAEARCVMDSSSRTRFQIDFGYPGHDQVVMKKENIIYLWNDIMGKQSRLFII